MEEINQTEGSAEDGTVASLGPDDLSSSSDFSLNVLSKVTIRRKNTVEHELHVPPVGTSTPLKVHSTTQTCGNESQNQGTSDESNESNFSNLSDYSYWLKERVGVLDKALKEVKLKNEELNKLNIDLIQNVDRLSKELNDTRLDKEKYLGQYLELQESFKVQRHNLMTEKRELTVELEEEKSHNSDLLMSINVADRVAYEAQEKNVLLEREIENLKLKLAALTVGSSKDKSTTECRDSILKKGPMPNVKSIVQSIERQARPTVESVPPAAVPSLQLQSPQREVPLPLRDQQLRDNKQTTIVSDEKKDPLHNLMEKYNESSIRNALLSWCQARISQYPNIEITNFSSSWFDGLALCALLHTYLPDKIPYNTLTPNNRKHNFQLAVKAAESVGIPNTLNIAEIFQEENADWQKILPYVKEIYKHFEHKP